jgi:hypothetical protein
VGDDRRNATTKDTPAKRNADDHKAQGDMRDDAADERQKQARNDQRQDTVANDTHALEERPCGIRDEIITTVTATNERTNNSNTYSVPPSSWLLRVMTAEPNLCMYGSMHGLCVDQTIR